LLGFWRRSRCRYRDGDKSDDGDVGFYDGGFDGNFDGGFDNERNFDGVFDGVEFCHEGGIVLDDLPAGEVRSF